METQCCCHSPTSASPAHQPRPPAAPLHSQALPVPRIAVESNSCMVIINPDSGSQAVGKP
eukprot:1162010-Pelagomonas_calceolata.AAC.6